MPTVMTWNVENLFRPDEGFGSADEATYQAKLSALAATVNTARPDLIGLQEVGDPHALAELVELLDGGWHTAVSQHFDTRHPIRVAVISRLPVQVVADVVDFPKALAPLQANDTGQQTTRMGRGVLAVRVEFAGGEELTVAVCHLKSKLLTFPAPPGRSRFAPRDEGERARCAAYALYRRAAEAVTVRDLVDQILDGHGTTRRMVLLGDLNDEVEAATTQLLNGPPGSEIGTIGFDRADKGDAWRLWNLAAKIPEPQRYSRMYRGRGELIDHILVSHALLKDIGDVRTILDRTLPSVEDDPTPRRTARDSDHAPVLVQLSSS